MWALIVCMDQLVHQYCAILNSVCVGSVFTVVLKHFCDNTYFVENDGLATLNTNNNSLRFTVRLQSRYGRIEYMQFFFYSSSPTFSCLLRTKKKCTVNHG